MSPPIHSPLIAQTAEEYDQFLKDITYHKANGMVLSNVTGNIIDKEEETGRLLAEQLVKPVQFQACLNNMFKHEEYDCVMEMCRRPILLNLYLIKVI